MKYCPICTTEFGDETTNCPTHAMLLIPLDEWKTGQIIKGTYRILGKIGHGGMGVVYRAQHINLEDTRALKVMRPDYAANPQFTQRFLQEARTAGKLFHPNSVRLYDFAQAEDGKLFIVMEYLEGLSARELLQNGQRFLPARALEIAKQVADVLTVAHAQEIIHRDIKPDNLMLIRDSQGREIVKVMDFGIAAVRESLTSGSMTQPGTMVGTGPYASPEQIRGARGRDLDGRSDLYSLGATLYEMLSGHTPYGGQPDEVRQQILNRPTPTLPRELGIPNHVDQLLRRMLAKHPEDRPANAQELIREINLALASLDHHSDGGLAATLVQTPAPAASRVRPPSASMPTMVNPSPGQTAPGSGWQEPELPPRTPRPATRPGTRPATAASAAALLADEDEHPKSNRSLMIAGWSCALVLALATGWLGWQWRQKPALAPAAPVTINHHFKICNPGAHAVTIRDLGVMWQNREGQWQYFNSDDHNFASWKVPAGANMRLRYPQNSGSVWNGQVAFFAANLRIQGQSYFTALPWQKTLNGCFTTSQ